MKKKFQAFGFIACLSMVGMAQETTAQLQTLPVQPNMEEAPPVPTGLDLSGTFRMLGSETIDGIKSFHLYHLATNDSEWIKPGQWFKTYFFERHDEGNNILVFIQRKQGYILKVPEYLMGHRAECCIYERKGFLYALSQLEWRDGLFYDDPKFRRPFTGTRGTNHTSGIPAYRIKIESGRLSSVKRWYHHGQRRTDENYWDGERHGIWSTWNERGALIELVEYAHGKVINELDIQP